MASNFEFYSPTRVIFGKGTEQRVGALAREYGGTRVLIVYGGKSAVRSGVLDRAENSLAEAGISSWTLGGVVPNPHLDKVYEGIRIGKENSIDFLLAVGGGSVIDTAKAIAYGLAEPEKDVWELYEHTRTARKCLPVASILTIAAAGSETSNSSVITRVDTHQKRAYNDDISRPKFALMDPELTKTLPDYQTESGCADIMMHTMERYFTNGGNMELTDALAEGLLRTVMKNAVILHTDPANYEARAEVMWAGSLSHNGLTGCGIARGDFMSARSASILSGTGALIRRLKKSVLKVIELSHAPRRTVSRELQKTNASSAMRMFLTCSASPSAPPTVIIECTSRKLWSRTRAMYRPSLCRSRLCKNAAWERPSDRSGLPVRTASVHIHASSRRGSPPYGTP